VKASGAMVPSFLIVTRVDTVAPGAWTPGKRLSQLTEPAMDRQGARPSTLLLRIRAPAVKLPPGLTVEVVEVAMVPLISMMLALREVIETFRWVACPG